VAEVLDEEQRRDQRADLGHEHDRVSGHASWVELANAVDERGSRDRRVEDGRAGGCHSPRCSSTGPRETTGKYVRPTTARTTAVSSPAKSGVPVGNVPAVTGVDCFRAS